MREKSIWGKESQNPKEEEGGKREMSIRGKEIIRFLDEMRTHPPVQ